MPDDPHALLGVARDATADDITEAYRALAQIYHPDRYVDAPARVQAEANARMQALNAAYAALRQGTTAPAEAQRPPASPPPPRPKAEAMVHYVDGSKTFHSGAVAPLGFGVHGDAASQDDTAPRCGRLDRELLAWFDLQRRNASVPAKQLYDSWDELGQAQYAAKLGASRVSRMKAAVFAVSCPECRP